MSGAVRNQEGHEGGAQVILPEETACSLRWVTHPGFPRLVDTCWSLHAFECRGCVGMWTRSPDPRVPLLLSPSAHLPWDPRQRGAPSWSPFLHSSIGVGVSWGGCWFTSTILFWCDSEPTEEEQKVRLRKAMTEREPRPSAFRMRAGAVLGPDRGTRSRPARAPRSGGTCAVRRAGSAPAPKRALNTVELMPTPMEARVPSPPHRAPGKREPRGHRRTWVAAPCSAAFGSSPGPSCAR